MRLVLVLCASVAGVLLSVTPLNRPKSQTHDSRSDLCSPSTLIGSWGFTSETTGANGVVTAAVGQMSFDHNRTWVATYVAAEDGKLTRESLSGQYEIHPDCTGDLHAGASGAVANFFFVADEGAMELRLISSNRNGIVLGHASRRSGRQ
jgi:hypothetical protein